MVRPHSGSPRLKHRPFSDGYHSMHHEERFGPHSRSQRGLRGRGPPGKAAPSWRDNSGGPPPFGKRPALMGERRDRPSGQWAPQNQDHFRGYPAQQEPPRGHRRPSPPRGPNRPPPGPPRQSPHGPPHGPPGHRGAPYHRHHSSHGSPSPRRFHGPPSDRRGPSPQPPHSPFRGPHQRPSPAHEQERGWGSSRHHSPRERPFERPARGREHWKGPGGFPHPHNGEARLSGSPQRKPREFHGRSTYPERWSTERDPRKQHGEPGREREGPGRRGPEWAHGGGSPHPRPPYRSTTWKSGPPPSSSASAPRFHPHHHPQEGPSGRPLKRKSMEHGQSPLGPGPEHGPPKCLRREASVRPPPPGGFGGRGLSLRDKSRLLRGRKFRAESVARFKMPPPRPREAEKTQMLHKSPEEKEEARPTGRKPRSAVPPHKGPPKKSLKRPVPRKSSPNPVANSAESADALTIQVESRRSMSAHSSSPIDRRLSRDLVVVSQWQAGPRPSQKNSAPWRDRAPKPKPEIFNPHGNLTLNERFTKLHDPSTSPRDQRERYSDKMKRPVDGPEPKPFRKPGPFQRPGFRPGPGPEPRRPAPEQPGVLRRPLMATIVPRPPFHQKPVFRKSQSIMSKYRNLQTMRNRPPYPRGPPSYRRW